MVALLGAGIAAAATAAGWAAMDPKSQLYGRTFTGLRARNGRRWLALTYDDGPNDPWTPRLLEVLARHGVHATFFMIGGYAAARPELARAVAEAGHEIGNHTFTHPNLVFASGARLERELRDCDRALTDALGAHSRLFRPPFGGRRPGTLSSVRRLGYEPVMWSVTGRDWKLDSAAAIEQQVAPRTRAGDVILFHDGSHHAFGADRGATVAATDALIRRFRDQGFELVTVGAMIGVAEPGKTA